MNLDIKVADEFTPDLRLVIRPDVRAKQERVDQAVFERNNAHFAQAFAAGAAQQQTRNAADLARAAGFNRWTVPDLAHAEAQLIASGATTANNPTLAAVQLALNNSPATQVANARAAAANPSTSLVTPQVVTTSTGPGIARALNPGGALASALSVVGGVSAPGRAGGAAGIVQPTATSATGGAVAGLNTVDQFFAVNPPDP